MSAAPSTAVAGPRVSSSLSDSEDRSPVTTPGGGRPPAWALDLSGNPRALPEPARAPWPGINLPVAQPGPASCRRSTSLPACGPVAGSHWQWQTPDARLGVYRVLTTRNLNLRLARLGPDRRRVVVPGIGRAGRVPGVHGQSATGGWGFNRRTCQITPMMPGAGLLGCLGTPVARPMPMLWGHKWSLHKGAAPCRNSSRTRRHLT